MGVGRGGGGRVRPGPCAAGRHAARAFRVRGGQGTAQRQRPPVIFVTALDGVDDRLTGFGLGADDYLVKPFAVAELLARVNAVLRRSGRPSVQLLVIGDLMIDEDAGIVRRAGHRSRPDGDRAATAGLPGQPPRPGVVENPDPEPGLGVRRLRSESGRGLHLGAAPQAGTARPPADPHGPRGGLPAHRAESREQTVDAP